MELAPGSAPTKDKNAEPGKKEATVRMHLGAAGERKLGLCKKSCALAAAKGQGILWSRGWGIVYPFT